MALTSVACTIGPTGISAPSLSDIITYLQDQYRAIYGSDVVLTEDTQDGQWIGIQAQAIFDCNQACVFVYNQFSPATSQGTGLSSVVKINGISRLIPTSSTVDIVITGRAGTGPIVGGVVGDNLNLGTRWLLSDFTIPPSGTITVTAVCTELGTTAAAPDTLTEILTPTNGWYTANNPSNAAPGDPVESDAELRARQADSTAIPSLTVIDGIIGAIRQLDNVTEVKANENDTNSTNGDGIPAHTLCMVVQGGDVQSIIDIIGAKKTPGTGTFGNTSGTYTDPYGRDETLYFSVPTQKTITVDISLTALTGYSSAIEASIKTAVANYISALGIGEDVLLTRLYVPAQLQGTIGAAAAQSPDDYTTFEIVSLEIAISPASPGSSDLTIAYNEIAICATSNVTVNVL